MTFQLSNLGWTHFFQSQLSPCEIENSIPARVAEIHRGHWLLWTQHQEIALSPQHGIPVTVGDWILLNEDLQLTRVLDRRSQLQRVAAASHNQQQLLAANVDSLFIVSGCDQDFSLPRIERYLSLAYQAEVWPVVVLSKRDLNPDYQQLISAVQQLKSGLIVEAVDTRCSQLTKALNTWCAPGQTVVMLGSSGAGKSTLANSLCTTRQLTGQVSRADGKGRHTTTSRCMLRLNAGGLLIDTPGMRELQLAGGKTGINETFNDIQQLVRLCQFSDCSHQQEPSCAVNQAIAGGTLDQRRLDNYRKLLKEQHRYQQSIAEQRRHDRKLSKMYKRAQNNKRKQRP